MHRTELAGKVCGEFSFHDRRGKPQQSGCLKALRKLEEQGHITLPAAQRKTGIKTPRRLDKPLGPIEGLPDKVHDVGGLELVLVSDDEQYRTWNEMIISDHPQGSRPLVGRQLRYLIGSDHGWLGGLGFAAAALQLADRDEWIGWEPQDRHANLDRVVGLSRLLIRSGVRCANLASRVLSMAMERLPVDFEEGYGYRPYLVETFVDTSVFAGTTFRAANWMRIGHTQGRGRQDRDRQAPETVKDIYVYQLCKNFRKQMGLPAQAGLGELGPSEGVDGEDWTGKEFGNAPLGDTRLSRRVVEIATMKEKDPRQSFCAAANGDAASIKAYYRFIDQPEDSAVTMENILLPHRKRTLRRMKGQRTVLCVSDGTALNYNNLDTCEDLGVIGNNQTGTQSRGLHLHSTLAVSTSGLVLGVLDSRCEARQPHKDERPPQSIPIEEKDTFCWIESLRETMEAATEMPGTRLVNVCDREADLFELFDEQRKNPCAELLVRAKHNRKTLPVGEAEEQPDLPARLFESVKEMPVAKTVSIEVPRQSSRAKKSKQKARAKRKARKAEISLRYMQVKLAAPSRQKGKDPIVLWLVHALEEKPKESVEPVEWFLLTTMKIDSPEAAHDCLKWYSLRWRIEDWHRVLKSGCRIEDLAHETAERLRRAIAINLVIAWRIMLMTLLGREAPGLPADLLFSDTELEVLGLYAKKKDRKPPESLGEAVLIVAKLGGYIGRPSDPPPGHQIIWRGYSVLKLMSAGFALNNQ